MKVQCIKSSHMKNFDDWVRNEKMASNLKIVVIEAFDFLHFFKPSNILKVP